MQFWHICCYTEWLEINHRIIGENGYTCRGGGGTWGTAAKETGRNLNRSVYVVPTKSTKIALHHLRHA